MMLGPEKWLSGKEYTIITIIIVAVITTPEVESQHLH